jgi:antagonist of KipI
MGYLLGGNLISINKTDELVSSAVSFGTIQLLPGGRPIILMADHQTTGGYPRLGHVISVDHSRLAQMKAGDSLSFQLVEHDEAEQLIIMQQLHLKQLKASCKLKIENYS